MAIAETAVRGRFVTRERNLFIGRNFLPYVVLALCGLLTVAAVAAPLLAPFDPVQPVSTPNIAPGDPDYFLGTDAIGRDIASRVLYGLRASWLSALLVVAIGLLVGGAVGALAAVRGGWIDTVLMRITDLFLALPGIIVSIAVVAAIGPSLRNLLVSLSIVWWPYYARIIRGEVRRVLAKPHVEAARSAGVSGVRLFRRHVWPGVMPTAIVTASLDVGSVVLAMAGLSFLGLGQAAPAPELGADTSRGLPMLLSNWWIPLVPGLAVLVISLLANLGGDAVRSLLARK
ncbi:ABC transporter permease [Rhodococcoides kyotonense]|uniref:Peptide/nickel transport system permease protein n=1 Tax=Rhodococcoides kyotonense TaxID=398843 RepID=A0A239N2E5_9NOCA|nr:ABC transporter permease [Rhodococcus kyotonensis]SNT48604.1 peptide/nickel transport system permease protein [Rhodococcus kyotonensis]